MSNLLIPKEVTAAWNIVAEHLHKNQITVLWLDVEVGTNKNIMYTLKNIDGFRIESNLIKFTEDYLEDIIKKR